MRLFVFRVDLCLLAANLLYGSEISSRSESSEGDETPSFSESSLRFITAGDSGFFGPDLFDTGKSIRLFHETNRLDFLALTGDLCYPAGFESGSDPRFQQLVSVPLAGVDIPIYPILGDNDYGSDEVSNSLSAYLELSAIDSLWRMPNFFYHTVHESDGVIMCALHIDTQSLVEVRYPETRTTEELVTLENQLPWIESTLGSQACQEAHFIVVFGHHPLFSASRKGNKGTTSKTLREKLIPLFDQYFVDAYFSGHDHDLQALTKQESGDHTISFIVSGSSSRLRKKVYDGPLDGIDSWRVVDTIGFTFSEVTKDLMITNFVASVSGETIHSHLTKSHRHLRYPAGHPVDSAKYVSDEMNIAGTFEKLVKRHGIVGPVICASVVGGSVYGTILAVQQIKKEWAIIKKNSRQDWKTKLVQRKEPVSEQ